MHVDRHLLTIWTMLCLIIHHPVSYHLDNVVCRHRGMQSPSVHWVAVIQVVSPSGMSVTIWTVWNYQATGATIWTDESSSGMSVTIWTAWKHQATGDYHLDRQLMYYPV